MWGDLPRGIRRMPGRHYVMVLMAKKTRLYGRGNSYSILPILFAANDTKKFIDCNHFVNFYRFIAISPAINGCGVGD